MNSQNYDSGTTVETSEAIADADRKLEDLDRQRLAIAERRRSLAEPTYKVVVAAPTAAHHKFTLGGVMVNAGFQAADADALAGLLGLGASEFATRFGTVSASSQGLRVSQVLTHLIDIDARALAGRGLHSAWERRLAQYREDRDEWLARDLDLRLEGEWRQLPMTADQRWLMRVTCRVLRIAMPGNLLRGQAADWLEEKGANLNYQEFV